jgi:hypothetical protein
VVEDSPLAPTIVVARISAVDSVLGLWSRDRSSRLYHLTTRRKKKFHDARESVILILRNTHIRSSAILASGA